VLTIVVFVGVMVLIPLLAGRVLLTIVVFEGVDMLLNPLFAGILALTIVVLLGVVLFKRLVFCGAGIFVCATSGGAG